MSDGIRRGDAPVKLSHGEFGPRVAVPRILELLARERIPTTWFVPGHTLVTFLSNTEAIVAGGHELACHGWYHEDLSELSGKAQQEILERWVDRGDGAVRGRAEGLPRAVLGARRQDAGARARRQASPTTPR